jgi:hypothetical protein
LTSSGAAAMLFGTNLFCWFHFIWYQKIMPKGSANFRRLCLFSALAPQSPRNITITD